MISAWSYGVVSASYGELHAVNAPRRHRRAGEEQGASRLRAGDPTALEAYADHQRISVTIHVLTV